MSPDHPLAPLLRELCPKRYLGWPKVEAVPALDPIEIYALACRLGAHGVRVVGPEEVVVPQGRIAELEGALRLICEQARATEFGGGTLMLSRTVPTAAIEAGRAALAAGGET